MSIDNVMPWNIRNSVQDGPVRLPFIVVPPIMVLTIIELMPRDEI